MKSLIENFRKSLNEENYGEKFYRSHIEGHESDFPHIFQAIKKFGEGEVREFFVSLYEWASEGSFSGGDFAVTDVKRHARLSSILLKHKKIQQFLSPVPAVPKLLWRGMTDLKKAPTPGQRVFYSPKRPITSWTEHERKSQSYCKSGENGINLAAFGKELVKNGSLFLWPFSGELKKAVLYMGGPDNSEWSFILKNQIPIYKWKMCE